MQPDCRGYLELFYELSPTRAYNEAGQQPLQPSEINAYLTRLGISGGDEGLKTFRLLLAMDRSYIDHHFKQQAQVSNDK